MWNNTDYDSYTSGTGGTARGGGASSTFQHGANNDSSNAGGFMNTTMTNQNRQRTTRVNNLTPCTIADIFACVQGRENFVTSIGMELHQVTIVAIVRSVNESAMRIDYELDDYSGKWLDVKTFTDSDDDNSGEGHNKLHAINTYVRVFGTIRTINNVRTISAFKIQAISDLNELTTHILEVMHCRLMFNKEKSVLGTSDLNASNYNMPGKAPVAASSNSSMFGSSGMAAGSKLSGIGSMSMGGLSRTQFQIHGLIRSYGGAEGFGVKEMVHELRGVCSEKQIRDDLDFLSAEGHVYSTIDDDHYKATDV